jgi:hypothetical protein
MGVLPTVQHEGGDLGGGVDPIIVCKFSEGKPVVPVIMMLIDKHSEVLFDLLIDVFSLPVSLGMESGGGSDFDTQEFA